MRYLETMHKLANHSAERHSAAAGFCQGVHAERRCSSHADLVAVLLDLLKLLRKPLDLLQDVQALCNCADPCAAIMLGRPNFRVCRTCGTEVSGP